MAGGTEQIDAKAAEVKKLAAEKDSPEALKGRLNALTATADQSKIELSNLESAVKSADAKSFVGTEAGKVGGYLVNVADKGRQILAKARELAKGKDKKEIAESEYQPIDGLKASLAGELSTIKTEFETFRQIDAAKTVLNSALDLEKKLPPTGNAAEKLSSLDKVLATLLQAKDGLPKLTNSAETASFAQEVTKLIDAAKSRLDGQKTALMREKIVAEHPEYFIVDEKGTITGFSDIFKKLPLNQQAEIEQWMGKKNPAQELAKVKSAFEEYKKTFAEYKKNPSPEGLEKLVKLRSGLKSESLAERVFGKNDNGQDEANNRLYQQEFLPLKAGLEELNSQIDSIEKDDVTKKTEKMLSDLEGQMKKELEPRWTKYSELAGRTMIEDKAELDAFLKNEDGLLKAWLICKATVGPFNSSQIKEKMQHGTQEKLTHKVAEIDAKIRQIEVNRETRKSREALANTQIFTYVEMLGKEVDGKIYRFTDAYNSLSEAKKADVRMAVDALFGKVHGEILQATSRANLESPKSGVSFDDLEKQFGPKSKDFAEGLRQFSNGNESAALIALQKYLAESAKFTAEEKTQNEPALSKARDVIRLISDQKIGQLEDLFKDVCRYQEAKLKTELDSGKLQNHSVTVDGPGVMLANQEIAALRQRINNGEIVNFDREVAAIKAKISKFNEKEGTNNDIINKFSELYGELNNADPKAKKAALLKFAKELGSDVRAYDMARKYLDKILADDYKEAAKSVSKEKVMQQMVDDPKIMQSVKAEAKIYFEQMIRQHPKMNGVLTLEKAEQMFFGQKLDRQYKRELRKSMTDQGLDKTNPALDQYNYYWNYNGGREHFYELSTKHFDQETYDQFLDESKEFVAMTLATLPVGMAAGAVGKSATAGILRASLSVGANAAEREAAIMAFQRGGLLALSQGTKAFNALEPGLQRVLVRSALQSRLALAGGTAFAGGLAAEGATLYLGNEIASGLVHGQGGDLDFKNLGESVLKALVFRGIGYGGQKLFGNALQAGGAKATAAAVGMETFSGAAGMGVEAAEMYLTGRSHEINVGWFLQSALQNALQAGGTHIGEGVIHVAGSKEGPGRAGRRMQSAEVADRLQRAGVDVKSPAQVWGVERLANGSYVINGKASEPIPPQMLAQMPPQMRARVTALAETSALGTHFYSQAGSDKTVPRELLPNPNDPTSARRVTGWTDREGKVHYNLDHLNDGHLPVSGEKSGPYRGKPGEKIMPEGYKVKVAEADVYGQNANGEKVKIISAGDMFVEGPAKEKIPYRKFVKSPEGKNLLTEMARILAHEKTHVGLENAYTSVKTGTDGKPVLDEHGQPRRIEDTAKTAELTGKFAKPGPDGKVPEGKIPLVDHDGNPVEPSWSKVQEFLCRVSDGSVVLTPEQHALILPLIQKNIPDFKFGKGARASATRKLASEPASSFGRVNAAAKTGEAHAAGPASKTPQSVRDLLDGFGEEPAPRSGKAREAAPTVERALTPEHFDGLLKDELTKPLEQRVYQKLLTDYISVLRRGDPVQIEAFKAANHVLVEPKILAHLQERYEQTKSIIHEMTGTAEGIQELGRMEKTGKLTPLMREVLKRMAEESHETKKLMAELKDGNTKKSAAEIENDYKVLEEKLFSGQIELTPNILKQLAKSPKGIAILAQHPLIYDSTFFEKLPAHVQEKINSHNEFEAKIAPILAQDVHGYLKPQIIEAVRKGILTPEHLEAIVNEKIGQKVYELLSNSDLSSFNKEQINLLFNEKFNKIQSSDRMGKIFEALQLEGKVDPIVMEIAAKDTRNILSDDHFDQLLVGGIDHEKTDILAKNIDNPEMTRDYVDRIINNAPEKLVVDTDLLGASKELTNGQREIKFYTGVKVHEGGLGEFYMAAILDPLTNKLHFVGIKKIKQKGYISDLEVRGAQRVLEVISREKAAGREKSANLFAAPIAISPSAGEIFYELVQAKDPLTGKMKTEDLDKLCNKKDEPPEKLFGLLADQFEALSVLHRHRLIHADIKHGQSMKAENGSKLGDFGSIATFDEVYHAGTWSPEGEKYIIDISEKQTDGTIVTRQAYVGRLPSAIGTTPGYYSEKIFYLIQSKGPDFAWKYDAFSAGMEIKAALTGKVEYPLASTDPLYRAHKIGSEQTIPSIRNPDIGSDHTVLSKKNPGLDTTPDLRKQSVSPLNVPGLPSSGDIVPVYDKTVFHQTMEPHFFSDPRINRELLKLADELTDPNNFTTTLKDAAARVKQILNSK